MRSAPGWTSAKENRPAESVTRKPKYLRSLPPEGMVTGSPYATTVTPTAGCPLLSWMTSPEIAARAVVRGNDEHGDVGDLRAPSAHRGERLVARRVEERDLAAVLERHERRDGLPLEIVVLAHDGCLRDGGMLIHPPVVLAGFASFAIPFSFAAAALLVYLLARILRPFFGPILWALLLAFLLFPLTERLRRRWKGRRGLVIVTTLGTGIGSALVHDGVLVPNSELGHLEIDGHDAETRAANSARENEELSWEEWAGRLTTYYRTLEKLFSPELYYLTQMPAEMVMWPMFSGVPPASSMNL